MPSGGRPPHQTMNNSTCIINTNRMTRGDELNQPNLLRGLAQVLQLIRTRQQPEVSTAPMVCVAF